MDCKDTGFIQAFIDCELDIEQRKSFEFHMQNCLLCKNKYLRLKENDDFSFNKIGRYAKFIDEEYAIPPQKDFFIDDQKICDDINNRKGIINMFKKYRKFVVAASTIMAITIALSVQPVRAAVFDMLSIFRTDNVKGFSISLEDMSQISSKLDSNNPKINIERFGKIESNGGKKQDITIKDLMTKNNIKIVKDKNGFKIDESAFCVNDLKIDFKLNTKNINEFMKANGAKTLLSDKLNGKTFSLTVPEQICTHYSKDEQKFNVLQYKKPKIVAPSESYVENIRMALIDSPFLPKDLANKLKAIKDWKNTLYIPAVGMKVSEYDLNGIKANLFTSENKDYNNKDNIYGDRISSAMVWNDSEYIYTVWGTSTKDEVINLAKLLR